ncbi:contractile injection system tape measure protein [Vibrio sp. EJY3]|uniref:contractile injection system tape measure protein n=1 Tax=Vibrio sp. (strain EJY3) TaxID=1116375 RepID=UPI000243B1B0|nr:contractile injection system tape measure protein [Vibrio sp. EJY3]AEX21820.1 hypothetical protein VEJY3_06640 [Vibrio sp. EJY3]
MIKADKIASKPETQTHLFKQVELDIEFDNAVAAEQFEAEAYHWLINDLLPSMDELLNQICSPEIVICIDKIELDTGDIASTNLRPALQTQILRLLYQELYRETSVDASSRMRKSNIHMSKNQVSESIENGANQHELSDYRWQQAWHFIETGQLAWPFKYQQQLSETGVIEALLNAPHRINNALEFSDNSETLCLRLAMQLPEKSLTKLLPLLSDKNRLAVMIALLETGGIHHDSGLKTQLSNHWNHYVDTAISNRNLSALLPHWDRLMERYASSILFALGKHSKDPRLPLLLIRSLDENRRFSLLERLEPLHYPFLAQLLSRPQLWLLAKNSAPATTSTAVYSAVSNQQVTLQLWHFTFHYVLVERGSHFNKQQYMKSVIVKMAAMHNLKASALFSDLRNRLQMTGIDSALRQQMMKLLDAIEPDIFGDSTDKTSLSDTDKAAYETQISWHTLAQDHTRVSTNTSKSDSLNALLLILQHGDEKSLLRALPDERRFIKGLLLWIGQLAAVRQHWSEHYSDTTLFRFIDIIEPRANEVVHDIISNRHHLERTIITETESKPVEDHALRSSLWQFTLSYLLVERGSEFNKRSYLLSLTHQIASRRNIHHLDLVQSLLSSLNTQTNYRLVQSLRSLLPALKSTNHNLSLETPQDADTPLQANQHWLNSVISSHINVPVEVIQALADGKPEQWQRLLKTARSSLDAKSLTAVIIKLSQSNKIRKRWIQHFDEQTLFQLLTLANKDLSTVAFDVLSIRSWIADSIHELTHHPKTSIRSSIDRLIWQWIWEASLTQTGLSFSAETALRSILLTLSNHFQIEVAQLVQTMVNKGKHNSERLNGSRITNGSIQAVLEQVLMERTSGTDISSSQHFRGHSASSTQNDTIAHITNWDFLQSSQIDETKLELALNLDHHALWTRLSAELLNPEKLASWIDGLTDHYHFQVFAKQYTNFVPVMVSLYQTFSVLMGNTQKWKQVFWRVIYHRLLLQGITASAVQLLHVVLNDLTAYPVIMDKLEDDDKSDKTKQLAEKLNLSRQSTLFPLLEEISRDTSTLKFTAPAPPASLDRSQPQVQRLYSSIENKIEPSRSERKSKPLLWKDPNEKENKKSEPISINNAGLVLASTYIPTLFQRLNLTDGKVFASEKAKYQALFYLQYLVDGRSEAPEYLLPLNKILCGIPISTPIPSQVDLPSEAISIIDGLLNAIISHWNSLGSTSIEGLRTTFIQREGQLLDEEKQWQLSVIPGAFDMLLDQIPWSFQTIKFPWMDKPLFVTWR